MMPVKPVDDDVYEPLIRSWARALASANKSPNTIDAYTAAPRTMARFLVDPRRPAAAMASVQRGASIERWVQPADWAAVERLHIQLFLIDQLNNWAANTAHQRYRGLVQWFKWLLAEGEIDQNPMVGIGPPAVPDQPAAIPDQAAVGKMIRDLGGRDLASRRDAAIVSLFVDTGMRRAEMAGIEVADIDLDHREVEVTGKGGKRRTVRFGRRTTLALDRYLRVRAKHAHAHRRELWLADKNRPPLKGNGIYQMIRRRGTAAGLPDLHPHQLRHLFAHVWLDNGGTTSHLMANAGWKSESMVRRYAQSAEAARARSEADRIGILDQHMD